MTRVLGVSFMNIFLIGLRRWRSGKLTRYLEASRSLASSQFGMITDWETRHETDIKRQACPQNLSLNSRLACPWKVNLQIAVSRQAYPLINRP
jgi:hypothetical protein